MTKNNNSNDSNSFTKVLVVIAFVVITVALYFFLASPIVTKPGPKELQKHENLAHIGGEFTLTDQDGNEFKSSSLIGKPSMIYFGFTYCPDICPATLQKISSVMDTLDKYQIPVNPVFITVDPARDNVALLKLYSTNFHHKFVALTGTAEQIKEVADLFKVYYEVMPGSDKGRNDYLVNHTSFIYLMDKNGKYVKHFDLAAKPEEIIEFIRINFK